MDKVGISNCIECQFFRPIQSATESGDKCIVGLAPSGKDGEMLVDPKEFGCIMWKQKREAVKDE